MGSSGSKIIGLMFTTATGSLFLQVNDIEISNCYFSSASSSVQSSSRRINVLANLENITITGCYFTAASSGSGNIFRGGPLLNLVFTNNISLRPVNIENNSTGVFSNNLVQFTSFNIGVNSNFQIHNNIFLNTTSATLPAAVGNNLSHNIADNALFGTSNNNQANVPPADIFANFNNTSSDGKYQIKEGGPADGKGRDGVDIGPFGGAKPYKLSGLPDIPIIYQLSTTGVSNSAGKLPITIKVRANYPAKR